MKNKINYFMNNIEEYVSILLFSSLIILCFLQILFRFVFNFSLSWTEELSRYVFIALVYISASLAVIRGAHVRVEVIDNYIKGANKRILDTIIDLSFAIFMIYIGYYGIEITIETLDVEQTTPALGWSSGWVYAVVPFSFYLIALRLIQRAYLRLTNKLDESNISVGCD
ncbi:MULTISPECIES: TRAP transporter small permease [Aliivibrio]|uniref:TRAP transporter small permease protein n=1 Tax=Aliivibrio fischeri SR5 TaxID=1088719 RepID=A0AAV3EP43_ALIFS|nr:MULTISPECIES: TRAP transporter small permease [Aliivibrio]EHN68726.1 trap-type c4-dicarboxylate transport system, small permease component [Aliivibrio fischeri SR5]MBD1570026.1 TRAP transporter small permease [Aliivibrio sp. S10_S31]MUK25098.1 TRAP transporter small permease subunit [Aliivibrio fischeri]MUK32236.1 TRAP transporter small permease subunit [Aliivibrio fischeri]OCH04607.1 C4-dicarboxylate ABC transporter permease [Aliivibrio fischeri]